MSASSRLSRINPLRLVDPQGAVAGHSIVRRTRIWLTIVMLAASVVGATIVLVFGNFLIPVPDLPDPAEVRLVNLIAFVIYLAFALPTGLYLGHSRVNAVSSFIKEERVPTEEETRQTLRVPVRLARIAGGLWAAAVLLFTAINTAYDPALGLAVGITVTLGGIGSCAIAYLLSERLTRAASGLALSANLPDKPVLPGVTARSLIAWALGTALPLSSLLALSIYAVGGDQVSRTKLAVAALSIVGITLLVSVTVALLTAKAVADPIRSLRKALGLVEGGDLDASVTVYDGSEVGLLQAGFNNMVEGLRERERIRDTFGAYVDPAVAKHVLEDGALEAKEVEVTVLFMDLRDFTGFAEKHEPAAVLDDLNGLFDLAVPIIRDNGGHVDKFVGDGLMAVFGAPRHTPDHAKQALRAAIEIECKVREQLSSDLSPGFGLNSGTVIAGNVGGAGRVEFSVIGDVVNVAARVEAATRETGDPILISKATADLLGADAPELEERPGLELKGKRGSATLLAPSIATD